MDKGTQKLFLLFILLDAFPHVISRGRFCNNPSPPICADDCDGNGYYVSQDGASCIRCPQCQAGEELNKECGNGLNGDAACQPCQQGFFSLDTSNRCTPCVTCTNTVEVEPCQLTQNRVCGDCLPGFVRRSGRFSTDPNACLDRCSDLPRDTPQCRDWWVNQGEEPRGEDGPHENPPVDLDRPVADEEVAPNDSDHCEPEPPSCIDRCHDGNFFLDYDGLCKACLTCQPGEQLNKVCGGGKNGDAYCRPCPEGTFSEDGLQRCSPCRICVNTVATECTASRNTECGECLPGYYQDADGYFPDSGACPNKCPECPNTVPQCQEWCESKKNTDQEVPEVPAKTAEQDPQVPVAPEAAVPPEIFQSDTDNEINDEANSPSASHGTYMTIFIVIVSLLAVVIIVLIIVVIVFRNVWKKPGGSSSSTTTETPFIPTPSGTPSPTSSPSRTPPTVYNPTVLPISPEEGSWDFMDFLRNFSSNALQSMTNSRPVSGGSTDMPSGASTPTLYLNRRLHANNDLRRHTIERQKGVEDPSQSVPLLLSVLQRHGGVQEEKIMGSHGSLSLVSQEEREARKAQKEASGQSARDQKPVTGLGNPMYNSGASSSSGKVVTEKESGTVHPHVDDVNEAPGMFVRRRRSSAGLALLLEGINIEKKVVNGRNRKQRQGPESEAALHPTDSSSDDGLHAVPETDQNSPTIPKAMSIGREKETTTVSQITETDAKETKPRDNTTPGTPGKILDENSTQTNAAASSDGVRNPGAKSPAETNVNIQITLATKDVETVHIGDVHNKRDCHNCGHRAIISEPNNDDDNEVDNDGENRKLLNGNTTSSQSDTGYDESNRMTHDDGGGSHENDGNRDGDGERGKLLDPISL